MEQGRVRVGNSHRIDREGANKGDKRCNKIDELHSFPEVGRCSEVLDSRSEVLALIPLAPSQAQ